MKKISVILVSYNAIEHTRRAIISVLSQIDLSQHEVIVVDNASPDKTADMVRKEFPMVTLCALDKDYGYAIGSNRGFEKSTGEIIVILSSDIIFPANSIQRLADKFSVANDIGVVCPEFRDFDNGIQQLTWQAEITFFGEMLNKITSPTMMHRFPVIKSVVAFLQRKDRIVSWVSGAAFLIRRDVYQKIQGFDENFQLYYEEADLFLRTRQAGFKILFTPDIKILHGLGVSTKNELSKTNLIFIQSHLYFYKKHLSKLQNFLLDTYFRIKFSFSALYKTNPSYRTKVDTILKRQRTFMLWEDF